MNNQVEKHQVGIWIDHKDAFIVFHDSNKGTAPTEAAGTEKHVRFSGHASEDKARRRIREIDGQPINLISITMM